jgi:hypothetical protein
VNIFKKKTKIHADTQREEAGENLGLTKIRYIPNLTIQDKRDINLSPKINTMELPGVPSHKTMIINRDSFSSSFSNQDNERCIQTPIIHPFTPKTQLRNSPLPSVFENTKSSSKTGLPKLIPITPARTLKIKSNSLKT